MKYVLDLTTRHFNLTEAQVINEANFVKKCILKKRFKKFTEIEEARTYLRENGYNSYVDDSNK